MTHTIHRHAERPTAQAPTFAYLPDEREQAKEWNQSLDIKNQNERLRRLKDQALQLIISTITTTQEEENANTESLTPDNPTQDTQHNPDPRQHPSTSQDTHRSATAATTTTSKTTHQADHHTVSTTATKTTHGAHASNEHHTNPPLHLGKT